MINIPFMGLAVASTVSASPPSPLAPRPAAIAPNLATTPPAIDPRIRVVDFSPEGVVTVPVTRDVVTRIVLEPGEKIIAAATGEPSKCDNDAHKWCVVADADANEVWVKPKPGASYNNLELKTDRRNYSFVFHVGTLTTFRVIMRYPADKQAHDAGKPDEAQVLAERMKDAQPVARNLNYTLQSNGRGADIKPAAIFDDGVFTYFRFPGNVELPTIFVIGSDGQEARANYNMQGDYMVVQKLARKFVLRLGRSAVSVWNQSFDPQGIAPTDGTRVKGVRRELVGGEHGR